MERQGLNQPPHNHPKLLPEPTTKLQWNRAFKPNRHASHLEDTLHSLPSKPPTPPLPSLPLIVRTPHCDDRRPAEPHPAALAEYDLTNTHILLSTLLARGVPMSTPAPSDATVPTSVLAIVLLSSAAVVLTLSVCGLVLCHVCIAMHVFRLMATPAALLPSVQPPPLLPEEAPSPPLLGPDLCYACVDAGADAVLLACGHRGLCMACATRRWNTDRRCPLCRRGVNGVMFLS